MATQPGTQPTGVLARMKAVFTSTETLPMDQMLGHTPPAPPVQQQPRPRVGPPIGQSGRANFYGLPQPDELNRELIGLAGLRKYDEMWRSDPDIRRLELMISSPILAGTWSLNPHGGDNATPQDEMIADAIWWGLTKFMSPNLFGHLESVLPILFRSGFAPFEQQWAATDYEWPKPEALKRGQPKPLDGESPDPIDPEIMKHAGKQMLLMPRKLDARLPRSVWRWWQDDYGELTFIGQILPNKADVVIPATDLVYYRLGPEGDNWVGTSLLRHAYKPWFYKDRLERIDAIGQERKAVGVPVVFPPMSADEVTRQQVETILANLHTNDVGYMMMPGPKAGPNVEEGWDVDVIKFDSSSGDSIQASLTYHQLGIAGSVLGDFMQLGHHQVGAKATADVQEDPFLTAVQGFAIPVVSPLQGLVDRITEVNWADAAGPPELVLNLTDTASLSELATYVQLLASVDALQVDPDLEDYLRERADLPPANSSLRQQKLAAQKQALENAAMPPTTVNPVTQTPENMAPEAKPGEPQPGQPKPAAKPPTRAKPANPKPPAGKQLAQPTPRWFDQLLSQGELKAAMDGARLSIETHAKQPVVDLAHQLAAGTGASTEATLAHSGLADAITREYERLYQIGHQTVINELAKQQKQLMSPGDLIAGAASRLGRARQRGEHSARTIANTVANRLHQAQITGLKDAPGLRDLAEQTAIGQLHVEAMTNAQSSINDGRWDAAAQNPAIVGAYYTSVLDENTCDECEASDTGEMISLDAASDLGPPNPECAGGDRCRCMLVFVTSDDPSAVADVIG